MKAWKYIATPLAAAAIVAGLTLVGVLAANRAPVFSSPGPAARLWAYFSQNSARTERVPFFPELTTRYYPEAPATVFEAAFRTAEWLDWEIVESDPDRRRLAAVATTAVMRYQDDVELRVLEADDGGSEIEMRSASRLGRGDLGANAGRIVRFHQTLEERLALLRAARGAERK